MKSEKIKWKRDPQAVIDEYLAVYAEAHPKWAAPVATIDDERWVRIETFGSVSGAMSENMMLEAIEALRSVVAKRKPKILPPLDAPVKRGASHNKIISLAQSAPIVLTQDPERGDKFTHKGRPVGRKTVSQGWLKPVGDGLFAGDSQSYVPA